VISGSRTATRLVCATAVLVAALLAASPPSAWGAPPDVTAVTIEGNAVVGETLTATPMVTGESTTVTYQWLYCDPAPSDVCIEVIDGQTAQSYYLTAADLDRRLAVRATAGNPPENFVQSTPTAAVQPRMTAVTIEGNAVVGETLTATPSVTVQPTTVRYQWLYCDPAPSDVCNEVIDGQTAESYNLTAADLDRRLAVRATAENPPEIFVQSTPTAVVRPRPDVTAVTIEGNAVVGETLTANVTTTGEPAPVVTYQWLRCDPLLPPVCKPIDDQTAKSYGVTAGDAGSRLAVRATAVNPAGTTKESEPTTVVPDPPTRGANFDQSGTAPPLAPTTTAITPASPTDAALAYLRPFPVVRVKGLLVRGGARVTLLRVKAPRGSKVVVRCKRSGCPLRRRSVGVGRIRALERFLRAGIRITIRVSSPGFIGKYVRLVIREGQAPMRRDACLLPGRAEATSCPPL
jgi:hypothetical protein